MRSASVQVSAFKNRAQGMFALRFGIIPPKKREAPVSDDLHPTAVPGGGGASQASRRAARGGSL